MFCMIEPDRPPFSSPNTVRVFWVSFFPFAYYSSFSFGTKNSVLARREESSGSLNVSFSPFFGLTSLSTSPSDSTSLECHGTTAQERKATTRAGQDIFLSFPEVSYFQWHIHHVNQVTLGI